jgi:hypothetical protein
MSLLGSIVSIVSPSAGKKIDQAWNDVKQAASDVGTWVDKNIIEPIKKDPITFIAAAAAYAYGIPGLEFAGAGSAAAVGVATTGSRLAQGDSFDEAAKRGLIAAAFTGAANYASDYYKTNFGSGTSVPTDRFGSSPGTTSFEGVSSQNAPVTGSDATSMAVKPQTLDFNATDLGPIKSDLSSGLELSPSGAQQVSFDNPLVKNPDGSTTAVLGRSQALPDGSPQAVTYNTNAAPTINTSDANSVYKSPLNEPEYVPGSGNQPATGTPDRFVQDPNYPNVRVKVDGTPGLPEVVDYSRVATPDTSALSLENVGDTALAAGENAYSFAAAHPYYTLGGAALLAAASKGKDKKDDQPTSTPDQQIGDPRFYMSLPQLQMSRTYNPYEGDYSTYGQTSGTHKFLSDPVYSPIEYQANKGGYVHMADGGYMDGGLSPQLGAPQPQMMPQQPMPQQSPLAALGGAQANRGAMPQRPTGALQKVPMQQQNPNYRYFNYGTVPPSVQPTTPQSQASQSYATGGLAMAHGGNVADGRTDNIHAMLSPGEYVMDAETVALLGNGNNDAGAKRLDHMREAVRKQKGGALSRGKISPDAQSPLTYLSGRMA